MPSAVLLSTDAHISDPIFKSTKRNRAAKKNPRAMGASLAAPEASGAPDTPPPDDKLAIDDQVSSEPHAKKQKSSRVAKYPCTHSGCTKTFTRPCNLEAHLRSHTGERPFVCTHAGCGRAFFKKTHLTAHIKGVHEKEKRYRCTEIIYNEDGSGNPQGEGRECGASFTTNQHLKRHAETHTKQFPHTCSGHPPCAAGFRKRTQLERHIRSAHLGLKPYQCKEMIIDVDGETPIQCPEAYDTKGKLAGHAQRDHIGGGGYKYFCEECSVNDAEATPVDSFLHSGPLVYWPDIDSDFDPDEEEASIFDQGLSSDEEVDEPGRAIPPPPLHPLCASKTLPSTAPTPPIPSRTPSTTSLAPSTSLSLGFKTYSELKHHLKLFHPPICKFCSKYCQSHRDLRNHTYENHTAPLSERRTFTCTYNATCTASFTRKSALKTHIATVHDGKKEFRCLFEGCGMCFGHKSSMRKHYERHLRPGVRRRKGNGGGDPAAGAGGETELLTRLTGHGYEKLPNRGILCVIEGCERRFGRFVDLERHLSARDNGHGFSAVKVGEVMDAHGIAGICNVNGEEGCVDAEEEESYEKEEEGQE